MKKTKNKKPRCSEETDQTDGNSFRKNTSYDVYIVHTGQPFFAQLTLIPNPPKSYGL